MAETGGQQSGAPGGANGAAEPVGEAPRCAGVGDPEAVSWVCWECLADLGGARPRMPLYALANDNWVGRERVEVKDVRVPESLQRAMAAEAEAARTER